MDKIRTVCIPACENHEGLYKVNLLLNWVCPICGAPRGEIRKGLSYDGGLRLDCDVWDNPCGHIDKYKDVRKEALLNGLNSENRIKYIASVSFGKDSLAMLYIIKKYNLPLDKIVFCDILATETQSGIFAEHRKFIDLIKPKIEQYMQVPIDFIKADTTFEQQFYRKKGKRAKHPNTNYGYPMTICAWCNDRLKMKPLDKYFNSQGKHIRYLGLAYDEPKRIARLEKNEKAPLFDFRITESQAKQICIDLGWLSPIYDTFDRDGCWFCPKQSLKSLKIIYQKYPEYWQQLKKWQKDSPVPFKPHMAINDIELKFIKNDKDGADNAN